MAGEWPKLPLLQQREIEARIVGPLIRAVGDELGEERALALLRRVISDLAREGGAELARALGDGDPGSVRAGPRPLARGGALEIEMIEQTPERLSFNVTRCRYAEMYRALGLADLGSSLSCQRDFALIEGFNPAIELTRTQTIMGGASHCDFRFRARAPLQPTLPTPHDRVLAPSSRLDNLPIIAKVWGVRAGRQDHGDRPHSHVLDRPKGRGVSHAERSSRRVAALLSRDPGDPGPGAGVPDRPDDLQPHAHVREGLGAVRRDGHLRLGRPDADDGAGPPLAERACLRRCPGAAQEGARRRRTTRNRPPAGSTRTTAASCPPGFASLPATSARPAARPRRSSWS